MQRQLITWLLVLIVTGLTLRRSHAAEGRTEEAPNVLFIAVDDLRPQLRCYGHDFMVTPHLDRLASEGRLFRRHFVQVPTCGASRLALLTGRYPRSQDQLSNDSIRRQMAGRAEQPQPESFAHHFRRGGYRTVCIGKISHYPDGRLYGYDHTGDGALEMPHSWDQVGLPYGKWETGWDAFFGYADGSGRVKGESPPIEYADVGDAGYPDGLIADAAIEELRAAKNEPFLLCVGFFKPHLPFCAPQSYFDLYDAASLPLSPQPDPPMDADSRSFQTSTEVFGNYDHGVEKPPGDLEHHRRLRRAYFACVSYVDAQIGRVLDELDRLQLSEKTIVVVWGDHGWHLGDQSLWGKHSLFERSLLSTLIIRTPDMDSPGESTEGMVETIDLYPTLAELCSLELPEGLDGRSIVPLLKDPRQPGKAVTFGFRRPQRRTLHTERYRLVEIPEGEEGAAVTELYDYHEDRWETRNIAAEQPQVVSQLRTHFAALDELLTDEGRDD